LPSEKYTLLRVLPFGILLMDGDNQTNPNNVFKSKKIDLVRDKSKKERRERRRKRTR